MAPETTATQERTARSRVPRPTSVGDLVLEAGEPLGVVDEGLGAHRVELVDVDVEADRGACGCRSSRAPSGETLIFVPPVRDGRRVIVVSIGPTGARTLPTISRPSQAPSRTTAAGPGRGPRGAAGAPSGGGGRGVGGR